MDNAVLTKNARRLPILVDILVTMKMTQNVDIADTVPDHPAYSAPCA
jgi:hypothetical protein